MPTAALHVGTCSQPAHGESMWDAWVPPCARAWLLRGGSQRPATHAWGSSCASADAADDVDEEDRRPTQRRRMEEAQAGGFDENMEPLVRADTAS